jgi:hydrogenase-4 component E
MGRISDLLNLFSILILLSTFILVADKRVNSYIKTFRMQSVLLAIIAGVFSINEMLEKHRFDGVIIIFVLIVAVKVVYIPYMLKKTVNRVEYKVEKDFFISIPISVLICCGLVILVWYVISKITEISDPYARMYLTNSISVVLIGLFFMISRKKAIGQIIGFMVIENGTFMAAILTTSGMPMIVELGIFFDLLTAVLIMGVFVFRINETFDSIDINKLRNLKG